MGGKSNFQKQKGKLNEKCRNIHYTENTTFDLSMVIHGNALRGNGFLNGSGDFCHSSSKREMATVTS